MHTRSLIIAGAVALAAIGCRDEPTAPQTEIAPHTASAGRPIEGWFHVIWVDPEPGYGPASVQYELVDERGDGTELDLDPRVAARWGGPRGLDRRKVRVDGTSVAGGRLRVRSIEPVAGVAAAAATAVQIGSHPYVTILCKFSDITSVPQIVATYRAWTTGTTYPGLDHYWRELSYNQMNVTGSTVVGWYTLPHPMSYYYHESALDLGALAIDCTAAADPDVNFPQFYGINLQVNGAPGGWSYGGSWTLTADGQTKGYGTTWLESWSTRAVYAHEEGHTLGLPHSSGPYGQTYDSRWDVMSHQNTGNLGPDGYSVPQHTISYHKDLLGWIPSARKLTLGASTSRTITLERIAQPGPGNYLMARIPTNNATGQFYTVEARQRVSYDNGIPGNAVVLHQVDPARGDLLAQVVDVDNNGDPNDAGAMWTPGETFTDSANGITVTVNAQSATGFRVTITRGDAWVGRASMPTARRALAVTNAFGELYAIGGSNAEGTVLRTVEVYNPVTNTWTAGASLPEAREGGNGAVTIPGMVYLAGGQNASGGLTRTLYAYYLAVNAWITLAPMPAYGGCGGSALIAGKIYVFSGCTRSSTGAQVDAALLLRFNPTNNTWTTLRAAPVTHFRPVVAAIRGKLYVVGGNNASGVGMRRVDMYDPATNTWSTRAGMPTARMNAGASFLGGKLYVVGGRNGTAYLNTVEAYDPVTNTWTSRPAMPTARAALGVGNASGLLYAIGGRNTTSALATSERFTP